MSDPVITEIDLPATPEEVWAIIMDVERLDEWVSIHRALGKHTSGPPAVGSTMEQTLALRGAKFKVNWELVRCEAPHRAEWVGKGPARSKAETGYRLEAIDGGTRFHYRNEFKAPMGPLGAGAPKALGGGLPDMVAHAPLQNHTRLLGG
jgi:carbon monoxide dehydrogenase subunit G